MDFILWLHFPIRTLSRYSRHQSNWRGSLALFVVRGSPPCSPAFRLPPSLLIEAIHSLARPLSSSGSLFDPCPQNFPSITPWLAVTLLHVRDSLGSSFTEILPSFWGSSEILPLLCVPVGQHQLGGGGKNNCPLFDLFIVGIVWIISLAHHALD